MFCPPVSDQRRVALLDPLMELILLDPPANGYKPGDKVSGMVTYDIASDQATLYDVRLYFDGNLFIRPFRCKFEAHRSVVTLVEESQVLFQGPFTLRQQRMNWHFTLEVPSTVTTDGVAAPVPPSMDHRFREGLQITVRYSIAATIRLGSDPVSAHQKTEILNVRPLIELTTYEYWSRTLLFPALEICTDCAPQLSRLRFWSISSWVGVDSGGPKQTFQFEMTLPSMLFLDQRETVVCSMKTIAGMDHSSGHDRFCITKLEFILRSRLTWQDRLEILQCVATTTTRPGTEVFADGHPVPLPETIGLQDFRNSGVMTAPFHSYDSVFPEVSHTFTLVVKAVVGHVKSGRCFQFKGFLPVIVHEEAVTEVFPPAYSCSDVVESIPPPSYL